ncbi:hypothetical protein [Ktedonospora formicarum]|uniref:hypothetical protein n=1 Tax=Ktedonospora formicarum TaxID=2778364 RepID=UPI001C68B3BF|nr:hypothetical protein [Ktedonospora formicarum]
MRRRDQHWSLRRIAALLRLVVPQCKVGDLGEVRLTPALAGRRVLFSGRASPPTRVLDVYEECLLGTLEDSLVGHIQ